MLKKAEIPYADFEKLDIRTGTIISAEEFKEAHKPAYKLRIDFGELGILKSSAQICDLYQSDELVGKQVVAIVNFPAKQIANFMSECLVLGVPTQDGVALLSTERKVKNGFPIS
jgi:tRNA-binding protein